MHEMPPPASLSFESARVQPACPLRQLIAATTACAVCKRARGAAAAHGRGPPRQRSRQRVLTYAAAAKRARWLKNEAVRHQGRRCGADVFADGTPYMLTEYMTSMETDICPTRCGSVCLSDFWFGEQRQGSSARSTLPRDVRWVRAGCAPPRMLASPALSHTAMGQRHACQGGSRCGTRRGAGRASRGAERLC